MKPPAASRLLPGIAALLAAAPQAHAHHAMGGASPSTAAQGVLSGIAHPVIGPDHLLFLIIAGLLMASTRLPRRFLTTALFVGMSALGSALHLYGFSLPWSDGLTAATVTIAGLLLAASAGSSSSIPPFFAAAGLLHGYAYGESVIGSEPAPLTAYLCGFALTESAIILLAATAARHFTSPDHKDKVNPSPALVKAGIGSALAGVLMMFAA